MYIYQFSSTDGVECCISEKILIYLRLYTLQSKTNGTKVSPESGFRGYTGLRVSPQPTVRPGRPHLRTLPGAVLDLLRGHGAGESCYQDAYTEDVCHHCVQ